MISYLSLPGESSKSTFQIRLKKKKNPQTVYTSKSFGRRPHPRNKDILLYSITKGPRDHHITKDYSSHLAFRLANFGKLHKILTSNLTVLCVCACCCVPKIGPQGASCSPCGAEAVQPRSSGRIQPSALFLPLTELALP